MKLYLNNHEWVSLFLIVLITLISLLPSIYYLSYGHIPNNWLTESGLYETLGAIACFVAGLIYLRSFKVSQHRKSNLSAFWLLSLSLLCIFVAGEEISWGQHYFNYNLPNDITSKNFQGEFNLHNSKLIQSSNNSLSSIFFKLLLLYLIVLPMLQVVFPTLKKHLKN